MSISSDLHVNDNLTNAQRYRVIANYLERASSDDILRLSQQGLVNTVLHLEEHLCKRGELADQFERNMILFGNVEPKNIEARYTKFFNFFINVKNEFLTTLADTKISIEQKEEKEQIDDQLDDTPSLIDLHRQKEELSELIRKVDMLGVYTTNGYESLVLMFRQVCTTNPSLHGALPEISLDMYTRPIDEVDFKHHQWLILFYLNQCYNRCYRKQGSSLLAPRFTKDGYFTHTYEYAIEISDFLYECIYPFEQNKDKFYSLTHSANVVSMCTNYLQNCKDARLPTLEKDRTKFAFRNGIFDARTNRFFAYNSDSLCNFNTVCANYLDTFFDEDAYQTEHPLDIPTPNIQKILDGQNFEPDVCLWLYACIGRLMFNVGELDNWQVQIFKVGAGGTGKSTLLKVAAKIYSEVDVGILMSEGQRSFSLEHINDKYVFFCYDLDDKMNFSLTRWNSMVSGEDISIERKHKLAITRKWLAPGAFAGNTYPPWIDQGGNIARRMLIFRFGNPITNADPNLFDKCLLEIAAFMKKSVTAYHYLLDKYQHKGIWDKGVLPNYFYETKSNMQAETNPLQAFVISDRCKIEADGHCSFQHFEQQFYTYCECMRISKKRLSIDFCKPCFAGIGARIVTPGKDEDPTLHMGYTTKYITGLSLHGN